MVFILLMISVGSFASPLVLRSGDLNPISRVPLSAKIVFPYSYSQEQLKKYNELEEHHQEMPLLGKALLQLIKLRRLFSKIPGGEPPDEPNSVSQIFTGKQPDRLPTFVMLPPKKKEKSSEESKKTADDWVREAKSALWHPDNETENKDYIKNCLYSALELDPNHAKARALLSFEMFTQKNDWKDWFRISKFLGDGEFFRIQNNLFTKKECLEKSLESGGKKQSDVWFSLAQVQGSEKEKIACLNKVLEISPNHAEALGELASLYEGQDEKITYLRAASKAKPSDLGLMRRLTQFVEDRSELKILWVEILKRDPKDDLAWLRLSSLLKAGEEITIGNQKLNALRCLMKHRELVREVSEELSKAINNAIAHQLKYCEKLQQTDRVQEALSISVECLKAKLSNAVESLEENLSSSRMWNRVGRILEEMPSKQTVILGRQYASKDCYIKAIELSPDYGYAWMNLAGDFPSVSQVKIFDKSFSRLECAVRAIEYQAGHLQDSDAIARMHLIIAVSLSSGETVNIRERLWTSTELLEEAVKIGRNQGLLARMYAIKILSPEKLESVRLEYASELSTRAMEFIKHDTQIRNLNGTAVRPVDLMIASLELAPEEGKLWGALTFGMVIAGLDAVKIGGKSYTHKEVCEKALRLKKEGETYPAILKK